MKEGLGAYCDQVCWAFCFHSPYYPAHVQLALLNKLGSRKHHLLMISILFQSKSVLNHPSSLLLSAKSQQTGKQTLSDSLPGNKNLVLQPWKICPSVEPCIAKLFWGHLKVKWWRQSKRIYSILHIWKISEGEELCKNNGKPGNGSKILEEQWKLKISV